MYMTQRKAIAVYELFMYVYVCMTGIGCLGVLKKEVKV